MSVTTETMPHKTYWKAKCIIISLMILFLFGESSSISSANKSTVFYPISSNKVLANPFIGWAPPADGGPYSQPHRLVYANLNWIEIEPSEGVFAFQDIEKKYKLNEWAQKGVKLIFRVVIDSPSEESYRDIPKWLYYKIQKDGEWYKNEYGMGFSPNYENPILIKAHQKLIEELGKRYDSDPRIAFIQIGSLGHWGEWHTDVQHPFPKVAITDQYVRHYLVSFPTKRLLMRRPHQIAKDHNMGLFNDMFGDVEHTANYIKWFQKGYISWLNDEQHPAMPNFWENGLSGGEFVGQEKMGLVYMDKNNFKQTMNMVQVTHISWLGPNSPADYPFGGKLQQNLNTLLKKMGYRFRIVSETHEQWARPGNPLTVAMTWENSGVAPFYYPWKIELSLENQKGEIEARTEIQDDIRAWHPGIGRINTFLSIPANIRKGQYTLCIAILDPSTGLPGIELAMEQNRGDKRYRLGKVRIN